MQKHMADCSPITIAASLLGAYGAGFLTHLLTSRRESTGRRRAFSGALAVHLAKLLDDVDTSDAALVEFHKLTRPIVRDECAKIEPDISKHRLRRFRSARDAYLALTEAEIENRNTKAIVAISRNLEERKHRRTDDYDLGRKRITILLKGIVDCAK